MTVLAAPVTVDVDAFDGNVAVWSDFESHEPDKTYSRARTIAMSSRVSALIVTCVLALT